MNRGFLLCMCLFLLAWGAPEMIAQNKSVGLFEGSSDVGKVQHPGKVEFDAAKGVYTITGGGENIWVAPDQFHFVWKKVTGDFALTSDVEVFPGGNPHRKAILMVRQTLDDDSIYADIAVHGDGLNSLQFREEKGAPTRQVQLAKGGAKRVRLVKRGDYVYMLAAHEGEPLQVAAGSPRIKLQGEYYIGIGVCAHDNNVVEKARFSNVELTERKTTAESVMFSVLETVVVNDNNRTSKYVTQDHIEAPNWMPDGKAFLFNGGGKMYRLPIGESKPQLIDTGFAIQCNNDHGISPDGKTLVISDQSQEDHKSIIYTLPITGGAPKRITKKSPSYWHGWSPDGKTLAYVGERNGQFDIYTISADGGEETRLTTAKGLDDGPEYTPDGKYIYENSERTGHMQIWRMKADGSEQEQVTYGEQNDWFPHFSPDGQSMVFLSYEKDVTGHPPNKDVQLRLMSMKDKKISVLASLFGGQGTINVPSWSPDGKELAFVSYVFVDPQDVPKK